MHNNRKPFDGQIRYGLKRSPQAYLTHVLWIALMIYLTLANASELGRWSCLFLTSLGTISFIHMLVKRNYFEVMDNKLIINRNYFRKAIIELDQIEKVNIEPGPFISSRIILKDKTTVKILDSQTNYKQLKQFMDQFNIAVE